MTLDHSATKSRSEGQPTRDGRVGATTVTGGRLKTAEDTKPAVTRRVIATGGNTRIQTRGESPTGRGERNTGTTTATAPTPRPIGIGNASENVRRNESANGNESEIVTGSGTENESASVSQAATTGALGTSTIRTADPAMTEIRNAGVTTPTIVIIATVTSPTIVTETGNVRGTTTTGNITDGKAEMKIIASEIEDARKNPT